MPAPRIPTSTAAAFLVFAALYFSAHIINACARGALPVCQEEVSKK